MDDINELIIKFRNGDESSFKKIVETNIKLITGIAKRYKYFFSNLDTDELIAEGVYGLFQAVKYYDEKKNTQFHTYARFWIEKYIKITVLKNWTIVKTPSSIFKKIKKILNLIDTDKHISNEEISRKLKLDTEKVKELLTEHSKIKKELSLDKCLDEDDENGSLYNFIPDTTEQTIENLAQQEENKQYVDNLLAKLLPQEAEIIKLRFGIIDQKYHTIRDVAKKINLSQQKVKEIEEMAVMKLKLMVSEYENSKF